MAIKLLIAIELLIEIEAVIETTTRRSRRNSPEAERWELPLAIELPIAFTWLIASTKIAHCNQIKEPKLLVASKMAHGSQAACCVEVVLASSNKNCRLQANVLAAIEIAQGNRNRASQSKLPSAIKWPVAVKMRIAIKTLVAVVIASGSHS